MPLSLSEKIVKFNAQNKIKKAFEKCLLLLYSFRSKLCTERSSYQYKWQLWKIYVIIITSRMIYEKIYNSINSY